MQSSSLTLNDVCVFIIDCEHKTAPTQLTGYPSIRTPNIGKGRLILDGVNRVSEETYKQWTQRAIPQADDLILAREAPIGNVAIIPRNLKICLGQRTVLIRPDKEQVDAPYLVYLLLSDEAQGRFRSFSNGSTVHHLNVADIRNFLLPVLPTLSTQHKIAAILSAYDDLIENNTRRIAILEEMAQSLYREWFVHFRFPGHEKKCMVESILGMIPEGWEVKAFLEVAEFINGFAFEPHHWGKVGKPIIKIAELKNGITGKTPFYDGNGIPEKYHIRNGDLLFSWSADLDAYIWSGGSAFLNQHLFNVVPRIGFTKLFLFYALKDRMWEFRNRSQGTTMRHIKRSALDEVMFSVPPIEEQNSFVGYAEPMILEIINLSEKNAKLRRTRDLLLPKLISGEVDVEGLAIAGVEEAEGVEMKAVEV